MYVSEIEIDNKKAEIVFFMSHHILFFWAHNMDFILERIRSQIDILYDKIFGQNIE